jgi:hypothetical protein
VPSTSTALETTANAPRATVLYKSSVAGMPTLVTAVMMANVMVITRPALVNPNAGGIEVDEQSAHASRMIIRRRQAAHWSAWRSGPAC